MWTALVAAASRLRFRLTRARQVHDTAHELSVHLELLTERYAASGMSADESRRAAMKQVGGIVRIQEEIYQMNGIPWLDALVQDVRYTLRVFRRHPGSSLTAMLILAVGIGLTAAVFTVVRAVLLKPLPYRTPERIVTVWETNPRRPGARNVIASANFVEWEERSRSFEHVGMVGPTRLALSLDGGAGDGGAEEISGFVATSGIFRALGVEAARGRLYTAADDAETREKVMVLGYDFWRTRLNGRDDVVGSTLIASGGPRTVVGVLPPGFTMEGVRSDFFIPYGATAERLRTSPGRGFSHGIGRLRDGVTFDAAAAEMAVLAAQLAQEFPQRNTNWSVALVPLSDYVVERVRPALFALSGAVVLVLLLSCANVANLLLARSSTRRRELQLRRSLGAGRVRLVRQLLTESIVFACTAGTLGLLLAVALTQLLRAVVVDRIAVPSLDQAALDLPMVLFTLAVSLSTSLLFGTLPAFVATRRQNATPGDTSGSRTTPASRRALTWITVAEVALSLILLVAAGLLIRSLLRLQQVDPGFSRDGIMTARVTLSGAQWSDPQRSSGFYTTVIDRLRQLPGVTNAAAITFLPLTSQGMSTGFYRLDRAVPPPGQATTTDVRPITPGFFQTMGIARVSGRDFTPADATDSNLVAIVSQTLARTAFEGENPLDRRLHLNIGPPGGMDVTVVGVVGDITTSGLDVAIRPMAYVPHTQLAISLMTFVVRTELEPTAVASSMREVVRQLDPNVPLSDVFSMEEVIGRTLAQSRSISALLGVFAVVALLLAGAGLYGVLSWSVSQRTREIGVRVALGAGRAQIVRMVVREAMLITAAGIAIGLAGALAITRLMTTLLYDTRPTDPATLFTVTALLAGSAFVAAWLPTWRAVRLTPMQALRAD